MSKTCNIDVQMIADVMYCTYNSIVSIAISFIYAYTVFK